MKTRPYSSSLKVRAQWPPWSLLLSNVPTHFHSPCLSAFTCALPLEVCYQISPELLVQALFAPLITKVSDTGDGFFFFFKDRIPFSIAWVLIELSELSPICVLITRQGLIPPNPLCFKNARFVLVLKWLCHVTKK